MKTLKEIKGGLRYAAGLPRFFREPLKVDLVASRQGRAAAFLRIAQRGIYARPRSPYLLLLQHAGIDFGTLERLVLQTDVEGALERLHEAGVFITLNEFKGRRPVQRGSLVLETTEADFDNPLLTHHYTARSGGSRGTGRRLRIDLDLLSHEAAYLRDFQSGFGTQSRPLAIWRPVPPATAGLKILLRYAKLGRQVERWFSQTSFSDWRHALLTRFTVFCGPGLPQPQHLPTGEAAVVARWLADKVRIGTPALLECSVSAAVRVCLAAQQTQMDIGGTFFRIGGEPYTAAKAAVIAASDCQAACNYSMSEVGTIGIACPEADELDDVHLLEDKLAAIQRDVAVGSGTVPAFVLTTLLPSCPKLMLNVESDDYGILETRSCGCPLGKLGFHRHISHIRSYEKLCSEGMSFVGTELLRLLEEVLPKEFGGTLGNYQLVEEEHESLTRVSLLVSPAVGQIDDQKIISRVLQLLRSYPGGQVMADSWRDAGTLRLVRHEPYMTGASKVMPLHILRQPQSRPTSSAGPQP
jgi:hypothetical protein